MSIFVFVSLCASRCLSYVSACVNECEYVCECECESVEGCECVWDIPHDFLSREESAILGIKGKLIFSVSVVQCFNVRVCVCITVRELLCLCAPWFLSAGV